MRFTRIFTGEDNQSHFQEDFLELINSPFGKITASLSTENVFLGEIEEINEISWHNPPQRQFIIMLEGAMEIEVGDGSRKIFNVGDIVLAEDTAGQGHITRAASTGKRKYIVIPIR